MPKLIVEIEMPASHYSTAEELRADVEENPDWRAEQDPEKICIDEAYLERDWKDDSFFVFRLRAVEE